MLLCLYCCFGFVGAVLGFCCELWVVFDFVGGSLLCSGCCLALSFCVGLFVGVGRFAFVW